MESFASELFGRNLGIRIKWKKVLELSIHLFYNRCQKLKKEKSMKGSRPLTLLEIQAVEEYIFWKIRNKKQSNFYTGDKYRSSFIHL